jgi:hypothetical protein
MHTKEGKCYDFYFADTREPQHGEAIKWKIGDEPIKKQKSLIKKYYDKYCRNMSGSILVLNYIGT